METLEEQEVEIKRIIGEVDCPKDFECYKSGFKKLCKVSDPGILGLLECLDEEGKTCKFAMPFGYSRYCQCRVRKYIAKHMHK